MKRTSLAVFLTILAVSACTSVPNVRGPFARAKAATQTDAVADDAQQPEVSPFPQQSGFGN